MGWKKTRIQQDITRQILLKSTDFLRRIIVSMEKQGGITLSYDTERDSATGVKRHLVDKTIGKALDNVVVK